MGMILAQDLFFRIRLNKQKILDISNMDIIYFIKINIESSPMEIGIRIRFLEINWYYNKLIPGLNVKKKNLKFQQKERIRSRDSEEKDRLKYRTNALF